MYTPSRGDIVWLEFDPQSGHEQTGRRPVLVLSLLRYNSLTNYALFCPITSNVKGYAFEVILPEDLKISGAVLCDQVKSLDWKARYAKFICKVPDDITRDVLEKLNTLLSP